MSAESDGLPPQSDFSLVAENLTVAYESLRVVRNTKSGNPLKKFGLLPSKVRKTAVSDVSLYAKRGDSIGIVGRNGSGKSSLLRSLAGLEVPANGRIWASNQPTFLGVSPALLSERTGVENIILGCLAMGLTNDEAKEALPRIADLADLGSSIDDPISTYSSGMGARLRFSISAAAPATDILMIDEALGTGDAAFQAKSEEAMANILENAGTIFFVSHVPQLVQKLCKRAIWLYQGEIIMDDLSATVTEEYRLWALAVKNQRFAEASERVSEAKSHYHPPSFRSA